jgi:Aldo/keto reductase family
VPHSPLGHGFLTGMIRSPDELADDDWRKTNPRFTEGNFAQNLRIVDEVEAVASELDATPARAASRADASPTAPPRSSSTQRDRVADVLAAPLAAQSEAVASGDEMLAGAATRSPRGGW